MRKHPAAVAGDRNDRAAQVGQETRDGDAARGVDGVDGDTEAPGPDGVDIEEGDVEHTRDMRIDGVGHFGDGAELLPGHVAGAVLIRERKQRGVLFGVEEDPVRRQKFQTVPLRGVVARRDGDAAPGVAVLGVQLHGRCRYHADVEDVDAVVLQRRARDIGQQPSVGTAVVAEDDGTAVTVTRERRDVAKHRLRCEGIADDTADTGYAPDERVHQWIIGLFQIWTSRSRIKTTKGAGKNQTPGPRVLHT